MVEQRGKTWWSWCALALLVLGATLPSNFLPGFSPAVAMAQDADGGAEAAAADKAAAPAEEEGGVNNPTSQQPVNLNNQSYLHWMYKALGIKYTVIFLALSIVVGALMVMNIVDIRRVHVCPPELVEGFEQHLNERRYQEAYELAKSDESMLGHVLSAGLAKISGGHGAAVDAMQIVGEEETMRLEHRLSLIQLIATISPMVGLYGTVDGMIVSFRLLTTPGVTPKPWELAEGVATALVTTLLGLAIAIPALAVFNVLKNRLARLMLEVGTLSEGLMSRFESVPATKK